MWILMAIAIALVVLAIAGYLFVSQKDKPVDDNSLYMMVFEDGLFELFFGLLFIASGILLDYYAGMVGILFALLYPFLLSAKALITKPRLDPADLSVDLAKRRQLSMFAVLGLMLLLGILAFFLLEVSLTTTRAWLEQYFMLTLVIALTILLALSAFRSGVRRLYLYALFVLAAYVSTFWLELTFPIYLIAIGIGVMIVGLTITMRFIQEHPKLVSSS